MGGGEDWPHEPKNRSWGGLIPPKTRKQKGPKGLEMKEKKARGSWCSRNIAWSAWEFWTQKKEETGVDAQKIGSAKCLGVLDT
jgi:hypothetical protein